MRTAIPPITDHMDALKHRLQREHNGQKKPRLQMLYLLASGQAHTRQDVAHLLGVHRNTIGRWLAIYAAGGLDALLATYVPAGKPVSLAPAVLASLEHALHGREGFASYEALRQWVRQTHGVEVKYKTLHGIVRTRFRAVGTRMVIVCHPSGTSPHHPHHGRGSTQRLQVSAMGNWGVGACGVHVSTGLQDANQSIAVADDGNALARSEVEERRLQQHAWRAFDDKMGNGHVPVHAVACGLLLSQGNGEHAALHS